MEQKLEREPVLLVSRIAAQPMDPAQLDCWVTIHTFPVTLSKAVEANSVSAYRSQM